MTQALLSTGDGITSTRAGWSFGGDTPNKFAAHIAKSVPHYEMGHKLIEQISDYFIKKDSLAYDIGCSTGTLVNRLAARHPSGSRWIGLDVEEDMICHAREQHLCSGGGNIEYLVGDACDIDYQPCDLIVAYYTVQFISPRRRQELIDRLFKALNWGGALLMFEKVRASDARFQDIASSLYIDFKLDNGYTPKEILEKSSSIKGVLEPFSTNGNIDMLHRAGFVDVMSVFKHICFEGFLAIK
jgi:tRNA (cmo5U34)-methyltransferase